MKSWQKKTIRFFLGSTYLILAAFFFYIDSFIFRHVIWIAWGNGSLQIQEKLSIFIFSFNDNMAYVPFVIYLIFGIIFLFLSIRAFTRPKRKY